MAVDKSFYEEERMGRADNLGLLKRLIPFVRNYSRLFSASFILILLGAALELAIPYVTKIAIDRYIVPGIESEIHPEENENRYLALDFTDPDVIGLVRLHPEWFESKDGGIAISYRKLEEVGPEERALLRKSDLSGVARISGLFLILIVSSLLITFFRVMTLESMGQRIMHDLRMTLFNHMLFLSVPFYNRNPVGRLVTRATNDIQNMNELFTSVLVFVFNDFFMVVGITVLLLVINTKLALAVFVVVPPVIVSARYFSVHARTVYRELRVIIARINTRFAETVGGMKIIQAFLQEKRNFEEFKDLNHQNYLAAMKQIHIFSLFMPVIEMLNVIAVSIVVFYGGYQVLSRHITLGELVAFISYVKMLFTPIRDMAEKHNILQDALSSAERIFSILDNKDILPGEKKDPGGIGEGISSIRLEEVSFGYVPGEDVLKKISFAVNAGEKVAFVGPTGSGKTSIMNLIVRFHDPVSGRISINGEDIRKIDPSIIRKKMALVPQDPFLFSGSLRDNIFLSPATDSEVDEILYAANCRELIERLPDGIDTIMSEGGSSLSSGERQLISIARAFAKDPELIILDEATSYIDSGTEAHIQKAMDNLMQNRTALIVAHRLSTAKGADRIIVLKDGCIVEHGDHDFLMRRKGLYFRLYRLRAPDQFSKGFPE